MGLPLNYSYNCVVDGVWDYHSIILKGIEIYNQKLAPPPKVQVNRNNINIPQEALYESNELENP